MAGNNTSELNLNIFSSFYSPPQHSWLNEHEEHREWRQDCEERLSHREGLGTWTQNIAAITTDLSRMSQGAKVLKADNTMDTQTDNEKMQSGCTAALLGYGMLNLRSLFLVWQRWNIRPINESAVTSLVTSFVTSGMNHKLSRNAVPVILKKEKVQLDSLVPDSGVPHDLVDAMFVGVPEEIYAANGRHRDRACTSHMNRIGAEVAQAKRHFDNIALTAISAEELAEMATAKRYYETRSAYHNSMGKWVCAFYDEG